MLFNICQIASSRTKSRSTSQGFSKNSKVFQDSKQLQGTKVYKNMFELAS
jgi:hypothetical protein